MRKLLSYILVLAFALPLVAQEAESKDEVKKSDMREWKQRGDMKRGGMDQRKKRMAIANKRKMHKKRAIRSFVRVIVIGGIAYYVGYLHGEKNNKGGWDRKPPMRPGEGK